MYAQSLNRVQLFVTPWMVAHQAPLSMGILQASDCHFLIQGIFLTQGSNLCSLVSPTLAGEFLTTSTTWEAQPHYLPEVNKRLIPMTGSNSE